MSISNETSTFSYASHSISELLAKIRGLEGKLEQREIELECSRRRFEEIFNFISNMLSVRGPATDTETTRSTIEDSFHRVASLTARQHQIMKLVLLGQPSKNIATDIGICQRTVENHRAIIMKKTGAASISALAWRFIAATWFNGGASQRQQPARKETRPSNGSTVSHGRRSRSVESGNGAALSAAQDQS